MGTGVTAALGGSRQRVVCALTRRLPRTPTIAHVGTYRKESIRWVPQDVLTEGVYRGIYESPTVEGPYAASDRSLAKSLLRTAVQGSGRADGIHPLARARTAASVPLRTAQVIAVTALRTLCSPLGLRAPGRLGLSPVCRCVLGAQPSSCSKRALKKCLLQERLSLYFSFDCGKIHTT